MRPEQARVWIINRDSEEQQAIADVVTETGGAVVRSDGDLFTAIGAVASADFPASASNPNVVVVAGDLDPGSNDGTDGSFVFMAGFRKGALTPPGAAPGLGVLAVACSPDPQNSHFAHMTSSNFFPVGEQPDYEDWQDLIAAHSASPEIAPPGSIERTSWEGMRLEDVLHKLELGASAEILYLGINERTRKIVDHELHIEQWSYRIRNSSIVGPALPVFPPDLPTGTNPSPCLVNQMRITRTQLPTKQPAEVISHSATTMFKTARDLVVLQHGWATDIDPEDPDEHTVEFNAVQVM